MDTKRIDIEQETYIASQSWEDNLANFAKLKSDLKTLVLSPGEIHRH